MFVRDFVMSWFAYGSFFMMVRYSALSSLRLNNENASEFPHGLAFASVAVDEKDSLKIVLGTSIVEICLNILWLSAFIAFPCR